MSAQVLEDMLHDKSQNITWGRVSQWENITIFLRSVPGLCARSPRKLIAALKALLPIQGKRELTSGRSCAIIWL
jgi:hypothetical protein